MIKHAIILAGGEGSRLRPVTLEIPKPLVPVQGLPILTWQARWFARHGVERVTVIAPKKWGEAFQSWSQHLEKTSGASLPNVDIWIEPEPMGTMGAIVHHLGKDLGPEPVFVTNGDSLMSLDLTMLAAFHAEHQPTVSLALIHVPNPQDYGVAEMDAHRIIRFHEKPAVPPSTRTSAGVYAIEPSALVGFDPEKKFLMFEQDLFPRLAEAGELGGCTLEGPWYDCGTLERWEKAIKEWVEPLA